VDHPVPVVNFADVLLPDNEKVVCLFEYVGQFDIVFIFRLR